MINVGPGQRETIKGGRDQDLLTPFWQTVALCVFGTWIIGWLVALALVLGAVLGYALSLAALLLRGARLTQRYRSPPWPWLWINILAHSAIAFGFDLIWTPYVLPWTPWLKTLWVLLCCVMIAPPAVFAYVMVIRIFDPNYPSPRKAVEQRQPQMPWHLDDAGEVAEPIEVIPEIDLNAMVTNGQTSTRTRVRMSVSQVRHWRSFCIAYTRGDCKFSGNAAEGKGVDRTLFNRVVSAWTSHDPQRALIDPASVGPRKTPEPTAKGKEMIALFASTPLLELEALLEQYEGQTDTT